MRGMAPKVKFFVLTTAMFQSRALRQKPVWGWNASMPPCGRCKESLSTNRPIANIQRPYSSSRGLAPRAVQPSIWQSIVPRAFREIKSDVGNTKPSKKQIEWNPATFFIIIFLLIGSNAIQMISLRNDFLNFSRKADAKVGLLREVIKRVQRGEEVDVEGLLGTGDEEKEREWEEGTNSWTILH